jgi:SAM-dependent methyltransferase
MSRSPEQRWSAEHSRQFSEHYNTMRGLVRREVTRTNLARELAQFLKHPRHIVDIGGGQGSDARWLAEQHHDVVLADTDDDSLVEAHQHTYPLLEDIVHGGTDVVLERYGPQAFDMVLSHGTLLYSAEPEKDITHLHQILNKGGYLSLLTAGKFGKIRRFEDAKQPEALTRLLATDRYTNNLGLEATAYLPQQVIDMLNGTGFNVEAWFGVRIFSDGDGRPIDEVPALHRNRIMRHELLASRDPSLRPAGQLLHFIARKNT